MPAASAQRKSRSKVTLDNAAVADLSFFSKSNRVKKHKAAIMLAEDELSDRELCKTVGISTATLHEWKQHPEFQQVIGDYRGKIVAEALKLPSAKIHERIKNLDGIAEGILTSFALRAERYAHTADTPEEAARSSFGSTTPPEAVTGLFVARNKIAANGKTVTDYELDTAGIKSLESVYTHIAKQLGQWTEKSELAGPGGTALTVVLTEREDGPR